MRRAAFDADVLVYAAADGHPLGRRVVGLLEDPALDRNGSVVLLPELLAKPTRERSAVLPRLRTIIGTLTLHPLDETVAVIAVELAARYRLRAADASHLATAVAIGADTFLTNNRKDFPTSITEIDVVYPDDLPEP